MGNAIDTTEKKRLEALSKYEILDSPADPAFDDLTSLAAQSFNAPISLISFVDRDREWIKSEVGTSLREVPRDHAFASRAIGARDLVILSDAELDDGLRENPFVTEEPHARFFAGYPLIDRDGVALGALYVLDRQSHDVTEQQRQTLRMLGHEAVMLLELRREAQENRKRSERVSGELEQVKGQLKAQAAEHARIEDELERRERQLEDAQRLTHLGSWEWDIRRNRISWSMELYRIYGLSPEELQPTYEGYLRCVHPDDRARTSQAIETALVSTGEFSLEERIIRSDGTIRILHSCGEVVRNEKGEPIRLVGTCQDITERKQTENKLQQSLSLLNATIEATADGILVVDTNRKLVQFNHQFAELWHLPHEFVTIYDESRLLNIAAEQLKDPAAFVNNVESVYASPECDSFDALEFKDGRTFERYSCPQYLGGEVVGRVWSFRDVTRRERALHVLQNSEERYRSLVFATSQIVWTAGPDGAVIEDSPTWRKFTGQTFAEMKGDGWLQAVHPRDRNCVADTWHHTIAAGLVYDAEFRVRNSTSEWRFIHVRGVPVREKDGTIREWVGFCTDITDRKLASEIIVKERDFSNALISSLPGIFYLLDETGLNLRWNENLEKVTGYTTHEIAKMRATDFVPREDRELLVSRVRKVFETGQANVELNLLTKSGAHVPFYCTGKLVYLDSCARLVGAGIDVSQLKKAQEEIKNLNTELERRVQERTAQLNETNKEMAAFSYTASHDLRSPIRAIIGFARAIREDSYEVLDQESRLYLDRIIHSSDRMMQLIDDLLRYARVGQQTVFLRPVAMQEVIEEIIEEVEPRLKAIGAKVSIAPDLPRVLGEPTLLYQIFDNLIENAITYRKQREPLQIEVSWRNGVDEVVLFVGDNGIGIAPHHHERIFDVFQRLHRIDEYQGTGIGLATVKRSVQKLGGHVWVESEVGKGSVFCVRLKRAEAAPEKKS